MAVIPYGWEGDQLPKSTGTATRFMIPCCGLPD